MLIAVVVVLMIIWILAFTYYVMQKPCATITASIISLFVAYFTGVGAADTIVKVATYITQ